MMGINIYYLHMQKDIHIYFINIVLNPSIIEHASINPKK